MSSKCCWLEFHSAHKWPPIIIDWKQRHYVVTLEIQKHTSYGDVDSVAPLSSRSLTPVFSTVLWINSINRAGRPCGRPLHVTFWIKFLSTRVPSQLSRTANPLAIERDRLVFKMLLSVWSDMKENCIWNKEKDDSVCKEIFRMGSLWCL